VVAAANKMAGPIRAWHGKKAPMEAENYFGSPRGEAKAGGQGDY